MKTAPRFILGLLLSCASLAAAEQIAAVRHSNVNVRGKPSLTSEVLTQLQTGDKVIVLEEVAPEKPGPAEPAKWARIQMPDNTPVWVSAGFIDPEKKTVKPVHLNVRAGPGENYSIVGRLDQGTAVKQIRLTNGWMEIETPAGVSAYVAADLLEMLGGGAAPAKAPATAPKPIVSTTMTNAPKPAVTTNPPPAVSASKTNAPPAPVLKEETLAPTPIVAARTETNLPPPITPVSAAAEALRNIEHPPTAKRIVRREGIVRGTLSIQAPTNFELVSPETHQTIDYLHVTGSGINLKDYKGRMITVMGEEGIDRRWPSTPVLEVQQLEGKK